MNKKRKISKWTIGRIGVVRRGWKLLGYIKRTMRPFRVLANSIKTVWRRFLRPKRSYFASRRAAHLRLGKRGEKIAARLLRTLNYDVLLQNYETDYGEVDMVARDFHTLCFIEVKTRHKVIRSRPADAVGRAKRRNLIRTAHRYLREIGSPAVRYRFDIVEVVLKGRRLEACVYHHHAFNEEDRRD